MKQQGLPSTAIGASIQEPPSDSLTTYTALLLLPTAFTRGIHSTPSVSEFTSIPGPIYPLMINLRTALNELACNYLKNLIDSCGHQTDIYYQSVQGKTDNGTIVQHGQKPKLTLIIPGRNLVAGIHPQPRRILATTQMLGGVGNAPIERNLTLRGVCIDKIRFRPNNVDDNVLVVYILLEFDKPLEVALMGYWFLSWHGRRRKIKKLMCV